MTCGDCQLLFTEFLDGQVPGALRREFEAHVKSCTDCASSLRRVRAIRSRLGNLERKCLPDSFTFRVRRALLDEVAREQNWLAKLREIVWPSPQVAWSAAVGSLAATVSIAVFWFILAPGPRTVVDVPGIARADSAKHERSVRYVLEHLPLEGDLIESTAHDTASVVATPTAPTGAQPVSASF